MKKKFSNSAMSQAQQAEEKQPQPSCSENPAQDHHKRKHRAHRSRKASKKRTHSPLARGKRHRRGPAMDAAGAASAERERPACPTSGALDAQPVNSTSKESAKSGSGSTGATSTNRNSGSGRDTVLGEVPQPSGSGSVAAKSSKVCQEAESERPSDRSVRSGSGNVAAMAPDKGLLDSEATTMLGDAPGSAPGSLTGTLLDKAVDIELNTLPERLPHSEPQGFTEAPPDRPPPDFDVSLLPAMPLQTSYWNAAATAPTSDAASVPANAPRVPSTRTMSLIPDVTSDNKSPDSTISTSRRGWWNLNVPLNSAGTLSPWRKPAAETSEERIRGPGAGLPGRAVVDPSTAPFHYFKSHGLPLGGLTCDSIAETAGPSNRIGAEHKRGVVEATTAGDRRDVAPKKCLLTDIGSPDSSSVSRQRGFSQIPNAPNPDPACSAAKQHPASAGSLAPSLDDTRLLKVSRSAVCTAIVVSCAAFGTLLFLLAQLFPGGTSAIREQQVALWVQRLSNSCGTVECEKAVAEIRSSIDSSVDPCRDFYGFSCGRWGGANRSESYMAAQRLAYIDAVNSTLWNAGNLGTQTPDSMTIHLSVVYRSCITFFDQGSANLGEIWSVSDIDVRVWTTVTSFESLFALVVANMLKYGMESVVSVRWTSDGDIALSSSDGVHVSTGTSIARHLEPDSRRFLVVRALESLEHHIVARDRAQEIERIDDAVIRRTSKPPPGSKTTLVPLYELDVPMANWSQVLSAYATSIGRQAPTSAHVLDPAGVRGILEILANADLQAVSVYLTLVPLAKFLVLESEVQHRDVLASEQHEKRTKGEACVRALELLFGDRYGSWLSENVQRPGTADDVRQIVSDVMAAARDVSKVFLRIPMDDKRFVVPSCFRRMLRNSEGGPPQPPAQNVAVPPKLGPDFIANTILFSRQRCPAGGTCEPPITMASTAMKWYDAEAPLRLLVPDFFRAGAVEAAVNYGTLALHLAVLSFQAALSKNWSRSSDYGPCFAYYVRTRLGVNLPGHTLRYVIGRHWSLQVALQAAAMRDSAFNASVDLSRLFFLRFGHTCCAKAASSPKPRQDDDVSNTDQSRSSCNAIAMPAPAFASSFDCEGMSRMEC